MFCGNCGTRLSEDAIFCAECGTRVRENENIISVEPDAVRMVRDDDDKTEILTEAVAESTAEAVAESTAGEAVENAAVVIEVKGEETVVQPVKETHTLQQPQTESVLRSEKSAGIVNAVISTEKLKYCYNCGAANEENDAFCYHCGTAFAKPEKEKAKSGFVWKKQYTIICAAAAAVLLLAVSAAALLLFAGRLNDKASLVYIKDNEFSVLAKKEPYTLDGDVYESDDSSKNIYAGAYFDVQTSDGGYLFYPQDIDSDGSYTLYRKKINSEKAEAVEIAREVFSYHVLSDNEVLYLKDTSSRRLYYTNMKEEMKLSSDVAYMQVSEDEKYVLWMTDDDDDRVYVQDVRGKEDKIKIASDVSYVAYTSDDLKKIVYVKWDDKQDVYIAKDFMESEKVLSDVDECYVYEDGDYISIYYTEYEEEAKALVFTDLVEDPYAQSDAQMSEPIIEDYQSIEYQDSWWGPIENIVTDDAYYTDLEKYYEKVDRDDIREDFDLYYANGGARSLYVYHEETDDSERIMEDVLIDFFVEDQLATLTWFDAADVEKVSMDQLIENFGNTESQLEKAAYSGMKMAVYHDAELKNIEIDTDEYYPDMYTLSASEELHKLYFVLRDVNYDDSVESDLFEFDYTETDGEAKLISEDVEGIEWVNADGVYYIADANDNYEGTLYINSERIADDVASDSVYEWHDKIYYMSDIDDDEDAYVGTLHMVAGGKTERIADDVADYEVAEDGRIAYLVDYNFKKGRGDLKLYKDGKTETVDTDVSSVGGFY